MAFAVPTDHRAKKTKTKKQKQNENIDKYLDLARKLKKLWKMKVMVIPTIVRVLGAVSKSQEKRWGSRDLRKNRDLLDHSTGEINQNT